jgi:signal transduction histidine kinase
VLNNLVVNAIKFSAGDAQRRGRVAVRVELAPADRSRLAISVSDNGIGMAPDTLANLFAPFTQAESSTRRFGGTGLGLAICKRIVDLMGGTIDVTSTLGAGACFTVVMPFELAPAKPAARQAPQAPDDVAAAAAKPAAPASDHLILVADDDAINRKVILRQLALLGHAAEAAADGAQALQLWRSGRFALLLTDLQMPEMDGYALTAAIRHDEQAAGARRMPIVALTANALAGEANGALAVGMNEYLTKPVALRLLQETLERCLPASESRRALQIDVLHGLVDHDTDAAREILTEYLACARRDADALRAAAAAGDGARVSAIAHRLKSSSRSIGALALGELCAELEGTGRAGPADALVPGVARFVDEFAAVAAEIDGQLA